MRCPLRFGVSGVSVAFLLMAAITLTGCSSGAEAEADAATAADAPFGIDISQMYITVENRAGVPIVSGEILIVPAGVLVPFRAPLSRLETKAKREYPLETFRSIDGTPFRRNIARARSVKITATDVLGKTHEHTVPFK